ncbi:DUF4252 domain-containing protein [uncultured Parabacteroides sp.]|jgi:hypothetical protein|uniref:DUF4252 domain-containing protein n=1 Tax=uncultured Parabacteroides sp. TaxID=512312 RepID=UPI0025D5C073|nr:DUF4252 domain-containing protein [uncultured Parabacteroides sp.]
MKRYFVILALLVICQVGNSQTMNQLFNEFSKIEQINHVKIGNITMKLASMFTETMGVNGIEVLEFGDCKREVKERFEKAIKELKDPLFETMVTSNEKDSRTKVLVRIENDMIRELVVLTTGNSNALVRIKGKIKQSDIDKVMKDHGNG